MPVLVEAFSVIIRAAAISAKYRGGWPRFHRDVPNSTFCSDEELARVGFMSSPDFIEFVELLEARGLQHLDGDRAVDLAVVNRSDELLDECDWLEFLEMELDDGRHVAACRLAGSESEELAVYEGWRGPGKFMYLSAEETSERMRPTRRENGVEVFEDRATGKQWYVGRTSDEPVPGAARLEPSQGGAALPEPSQPPESGAIYEDGTPYVKRIREGLPREEAIVAFVDACGRRNTLFPTQRLIEDRLPAIEWYLGETISADEAAALCDLARTHATSACVIAWLTQRPGTWKEYAEGAGQQVGGDSELDFSELGLLKEMLPGYQAAKARLEARAQDVPFCADCGRAPRWVFLGYGFDRLNIGWAAVCVPCRRLARAPGESAEPRTERRLRELLRDYWRQ